MKNLYQGGVTFKSTVMRKIVAVTSCFITPVSGSGISCAITLCLMGTLTIVSKAFRPDLLVKVLGQRNNGHLRAGGLSSLSVRT